ncbi:hypothetical protein C8J57DRAFT_1285892 [Mycena rebaudengoi]|nr:hypothetical protein C8J57DRAFT_1285892 [Mycena rebaudengoi]
MPFDPPSPVRPSLLLCAALTDGVGFQAHCFMKDSAVAAVAQGPYWTTLSAGESGQHPDDYQILSAPLKPEFFVAPRRRHDTLLWYRTSFKLGKDKFLPMSFLIWDLELTWASSYIYLHERAHHLLKSHGRFDRHLHHMRFVNGLVCYPDNMTSSLQPPNMQPFNLMGEELIRRLELVRKPNGGGWRWRHGMEYW